MAADRTDARTLVELRDDPIDGAALHDVVAHPSCGAVVSFTGLVRDHAEGRDGVEWLEYEAYEGPAEQRMRAVVDEARRRWPEVHGIAVSHRVGRLAVGEVAVAVAVSAPHRVEAFAAAAFVIDEVKATVPIWKRESWAGGEGWGTCACELAEVGAGPGPADGPGAPPAGVAR